MIYTERDSKFSFLARLKAAFFFLIDFHWVYFFCLFFSNVSFAEGEKQDLSIQNENGYTINYNTVSILEYIRFASKICNTNFIYNENDLTFTVSVVSDAPITAENVMATLLQVLRINGFTLLEQGNNLVIHSASDVRQIATLVTSGSQEGKAPIVTRIFRIKNAKAESLAAIIRPMISSGSILEVSIETRQLILTDITANVDKVAALIDILDSPYTPLDIKSFDVTHNRVEVLIDIANQLMAPLTQGNPFILVPQPSANTIFVVSTSELADRALSILATLDTPPKRDIHSVKKIGPDTVLVYKIEHRPGHDILTGLNSIADSLAKSGIPEGDLLDTIKTVHFIPQTNSLMFSGSPKSLAKVKEFLASLDTASPHATSSSSFFIYKPLNRSPNEIEKAIIEMARSLKGTKGTHQDLIATVESVHINSMTHTLTFSGEAKTFPQIQEMLASIDAPSGKAQAAAKNNFFIYKIQHAPYSAIESSLKFFVGHLDKSNASEEGLIQAVQGMKYIEETNSILFTGPDASLKRLQEVVTSFDANIDFPPVTNQFFVYKPKNLPGETLASSLRELGSDLKGNHLTDPAFLQALHSMKWIKANNSLLFTGDKTAIKKIEDLIATLDVDSDRKTKPSYYIYKLQNTSADVIEEDLDNLVKSFKSSGMKDTKLIHAIENLRHVKETNSFLITGDSYIVEEVKQLILDYDYPRASAKLAQSNFLMYKPQFISAAEMEKSLKEVTSNLKKADLADPNLLAAIESIKYIDTTNSLLFTGTPDSLQKLQTLIKDVDVPPQQHTSIQHMGKTTFLLYKLKNASGTNVLSSLKTMSIDLKKSGAGDKDFLATLQSVKYIKETNSLLFTGNEKSLSQAQSLVEQFDIVGLAAPQFSPEEFSGSGHSDFFVYKPVSLTGPELETVTNDFADNLKSSGLSDPDLFKAIHSMRWVEQTQSLIFTGTPKSLDQVKQLITAFDIPSNIPGGPLPTGPSEASIQGVDNTNFLVYKLQFHKGDEIQGALRQIAKDLLATNAPVNQNLLNAINSIQWIQVTNSLLCSGDKETLSRLRDLIKNLDIALKQVFIEMLVIETNLFNALQFGLEWGGKYKYRNKFQGTINNIIPPPAGGPCVTDQTMTTLNNFIPNTASGVMPVLTDNMPFGCGFDLGIIGQVIKHGGQTFLTLGSLLTAIQSDDETSVILTPKIITQDGRTSSIFVGQNVPFVGSFVNTQGQNTVQTSNIEYRDIGLNLTITPVLGNSDIVTLDINLDRSQTITDLNNSAINFSNTSANGIITSKTTMQTTVHVPDKNFLILSGFVNNSNVKSKSGIPCLGGLPFIGAAFSKDNNSINNTNIVIFLRPHIINSLDDLRRLTSDQEDAFRDQQGTPFLMKQFDEGMELIKSIDDE